MNNSKVFITGISGFVGRNLQPYLTNQYDVQGISRNYKLEGLTYEEFFNDCHSYDVMIHLAGKAHDLKKSPNDEEYYEVNYELTKRLYNQFLQSNAKKFIYISSVKAVADTVEGFLIEDVSPNPITAYGKSKLMAEDYILNHLPLDKQVYVLRPCMIHGPGNKGNLNLLHAIITRGIPYPLAAFENSRSFLSIENLCFVIKELLEQSIIPSGVYNMADDENISTNELISLISMISSQKPKLWKIPKKIIITISKIGDLLNLPLNSERLKKMTESYLVSNDKIKKVLKINNLPLTAHEGLKKTIMSFNNINKANKKNENN